MGIVEEILKNKEELLVKLLQVIEGKETSAKVSLDGLELQLGEAKVRLNGSIQFTYVPPKKK